MSTLCASDAFCKQIKSLRITDFPCGQGSWREKPEKYSSRYDSSDAQCETVEHLLELERSGPYAVDCSWSKETASLRRVAIESPESLNDPSIVMKHFTMLRIVDKNVSEVDSGMSKFINLKELILCANLIDKLDGRNFPPGLEVLELAANNVKDLSGLRSDNLSSLLHLGLAHNKVASITSHSLAPSKWPSLLSLDLSYNNLSDLQATVGILKHLSTLRNLLLVGNPLYLSKCYQGFVIDNMPGLSFLDNAEVSADDRHHFKSLSRIKDLDINCSHVIAEIAGINGVKKPVETEEPDSVSEYPKIEYKYHVEFLFVKDTSSEVGGEETPEDLQTVSTGKLPWAEAVEFNFKQTFRIRDLANLRDFLRDGLTFTVVAVKHSYVLEDPRLNDDLNSPNKNQQGTMPDKQVTKSASKDRSKENKDKSKSSGDKNLNPKDKKDKGKKDKRDLGELFELPQVRRVVGSCHVPLTSFLDGEVAVKLCCPSKEEDESVEGNECSGNENSPFESAQPQSARRSDVSDKKKTKGEGDKIVKSTLTKGGKGKDQAKPAAQATKAAKGGKGKDKGEEITEEAEDEVPPPPSPLSIDLEIKLDRLKCTRDALQDVKN